MVRTAITHLAILLADMKQDFNLDFVNPMQSENVLTDFDFDSFLQDGTGAEDGTFDFNSGFSMEPDTTIGATD